MCSCKNETTLSPLKGLKSNAVNKHLLMQHNNFLSLVHGLLEGNECIFRSYVTGETVKSPTQYS